MSVLPDDEEMYLTVADTGTGDAISAVNRGRAVGVVTGVRYSIRCACRSGGIVAYV